MRIYDVTPATGEARLDAYLAAQAEMGLSRSRIQALIKSGHITVNGKSARPSQSIGMGDQIRVEIPPPQPTDLVPEPIPLDVVYEDNDIIVINKQRGLVVHPAAGHWSGTLVNGLLERVDDLQGVGGELRPGIVHRLDKDTTGLLMAAKNERAMEALSSQIQERRVQRVYWALVHGNQMAQTGRIEAPIGRHSADRKRMAVDSRNGKNAVTRFQVLEHYKGYALLECYLETGRTHQIRVHLSFIGHPVVADPVYGTRKAHLQMEPQALHARTLGFFHPHTAQWMEFTVEPPPDMMAVIERLRQEG